MTKRNTRGRKPNTELFDAAKRRLGTAEYRPIESLIAHRQDPRRHPERQLVELMASIRRFGFVMPVLVDGGGTVIAGHARIEAARRAGLVEVPVLAASDWTEAQIRSYQLADNRLTKLATWDEQPVMIELSGLLGVDEMLNGLGWEPSEIDLMLSEDGANGERQPSNAASQLPPVVVSRLGSSWFFALFRLARSDGGCKAPLEYLPADRNFFALCVVLALRHWASMIGKEPVFA